MAPTEAFTRPGGRRVSLPIMREMVAGTGWLLVGVGAAIGVWSGLADPLVVAFDGVLPGGWRRVVVGFLVFAACCALYFRSHWAATLATLVEQGPGATAAARRMEEAAADLERSAHVIADNLLEVEGHVADRSAGLYLEGAKAHAAKLPQVAVRLRNTAAGLANSKPSE